MVFLTVCALCACEGCAGQKKAPEVECHAVAKHYMGAGIWILSQPHNLCLEIYRNPGHSVAIWKWINSQCLELVFPRNHLFWSFDFIFLIPQPAVFIQLLNSSLTLLLRTWRQDSLKGVNLKRLQWILDGGIGTQACSMCWNMSFTILNFIRM